LLYNPPTHLTAEENAARYEALIIYFDGMADYANGYAFALEYYQCMEGLKDKEMKNYSRRLCF